MDAMYEMGLSIQEGKEMNKESFMKLTEYYETDWKKITMRDDGTKDWEATYQSEDFNGDKLISWTEMFNALMRADMADDKTLTWVYDHMLKFGNKEGTVNFDQYMEMINEFARQEEAKKDGGSKARMEIHMEEHPDGSSKMTIVMEGAKNLAASAAAVATMALFAQ